MSPSELIEQIRVTATSEGIDLDLPVAIAMRESSLAWPKSSSRFEKNWHRFVQPELFAALNLISIETEMREQMTSWGPSHVMGAVIRELGFRGSLPECFQPGLGIYYGVRKIMTLEALYDSEPSLIAAYNAGHARKLPGGLYTNQAYVDAVTTNLKKLRGCG